MEELLSEEWRIAWILFVAHGDHGYNKELREFPAFQKLVNEYVDRFALPEIRQFPVLGPVMNGAIAAELAIRDYLKHGEVMPLRNARHTLMGKAY